MIMDRTNYKISELHIAKQDFRAVFKTGLGHLLEDNLLIASLGLVLIDVIKLDAYLLKEHPEIAAEEISQNAVVFKYYGEPGVELIDKLTIQ